MALAAIPLRMAAMLPFLVLTLLARAAADEWAPVEAALKSDDQCAAGDMKCALNALQRRGAALAKEAAEELDRILEGAEEESAGSRRRRSQGRPDLSVEGEKKLKKRIVKTSNTIKEDFKTLRDLEEQVNVTYNMVVTDAPEKDAGGGGVGGGSGGGPSRPDDKHPDVPEDSKPPPTLLEVDAEDSSTAGRRRTFKPPPRVRHVKSMVDKCENVMKKFWRRMTRLDRLCEWIKMKIKIPNAPDWQEPTDLDDDDDDEDDDEKKDESFLEMKAGSSQPGELQGKLVNDVDEAGDSAAMHAKEMNNEDMNMAKLVDELDKEVDRASVELTRIKKLADTVRTMAKNATAGA